MVDKLGIEHLEEVSLTRRNTLDKKVAIKSVRGEDIYLRIKKDRNLYRGEVCETYSDHFSFSARSITAGANPMWNAVNYDSVMGIWRVRN